MFVGNGTNKLFYIIVLFIGSPMQWRIAVET
jgi:hypothetical protein